MVVRVTTFVGENKLSAPADAVTKSLEGVAQGSEEAAIGLDALQQVQKDAEKLLDSFASTTAKATTQSKAFVGVQGNMERVLALSARATRIAARGQEEYETKTEDAIRKMGEFNATNEQMRRGVVQTDRMARKFGVSMGQAGEVLEELAFQTQKPAEALRLQEQALRVLARTQGRADEAAEAVAKAQRGETDVLRMLSAAGRRAADQIDKVADAELRAKLTTKALNRELANGPNIADKMTDRLQAMRVQVNSAFGGFDVAGGAVKGLGIAVAAAGVAMAAAGTKAIQFGVDATKTYLSVTPRAIVEVDLLERSMKELKLEIGEAIVQETNMLSRTQDLAISIKFMATQVDVLQLSTRRTVRDVQNITGDLGALGGSIAQTIPRILGLGDALDKLTKSRGDFADAEKKRIEDSREFSTVINQATNDENKFARTIQTISDKIRKDAKLTERELAITRNVRGIFHQDLEDQKVRLAEKDLKEGKAAASAHKAAGAAANKRKTELRGLFGTKKDMEGFSGNLTKEFERIAKEDEKIEKERAVAIAEIREKESKEDIERRLRVPTETEQRVEKFAQIKEGPDPEGVFAAAERDLDIALVLQDRMRETGATAEQVAADMRIGVGKNLTALERGVQSVSGLSIEASKKVAEGIKTLTGSIADGMANMAEGLVDGSFSLKNFASSVAGTIGDMLISTGKGLGIFAAVTLNPAMAAGAAALVIAGGVLKGTANKAAQSADARGSGSSSSASVGSSAPSGAASASSATSTATFVSPEVRRGEKAQKEGFSGIQASIVSLGRGTTRIGNLAHDDFVSTRQDRRDDEKARQDFQERQAQVEETRNRTFLTTLERSLTEVQGRAADREVIQQFTGATFLGGRGRSPAERASAMRAPLGKLMRQQNIVTPGGNPFGLTRTGL